MKCSAPPVFKFNIRAIQRLNPVRVCRYRHQRPRRAQGVVACACLHRKRSHDARRDTPSLQTWYTSRAHTRAHRCTSCGSCISLAKSSAPNATAATRGLAPHISAAFKTPRAVSIQGIMHRRRLRLRDASNAHSSASMQRTSSLVCTCLGV